jgi:hypothetical protein
MGASLLLLAFMIFFYDPGSASPDDAAKHRDD